MTGIERIAAERARQIEIEGWDADHDSMHDPDTLELAASCYAAPPSHRGSKTIPHHYTWANGGRHFDDDHLIPIGEVDVPVLWPWDGCWWKPSTRERDLEKAGALIAAALDLRQRK